MREDLSRKKIVYKSHMVDDGWNLPKEVIEEIEYAILESRQEAMRKVRIEHKRHKGDWLTQEVANSYIAKSWIYRVISDNQFIGMLRKYVEELQELYGVTEIEAINILQNRNVEDYVEKYQRIKNLIPVYRDEKEISEDIISVYLQGIS